MINTMELEFGTLFKTYRTRAGLSLKNVSDKTGITDTRLMRIEKGGKSSKPNEEEIRILSTFYNLPGDMVFHALGYSHDADVLKKYYSLSPADRAAIDTMITQLLSQEQELNDHIFRLGELFSGPGGLAWGAMHASIPGTDYKIVHAWANDFDASTCETYRRNICPENADSVICQDVKTLNIDSLGSIDAFAFGFPCNDFSLVGEQKGLDGRYGALYTYGVKVLKKYRPKWFLAENVSGLQSANEGNAFGMILKDLKDCGYKLYPNLYSFEQYGIPQTRHRVIIVGIRDDLPYEFRVPSPESYKDADVSCRNAIENPPIEEDAFNNEKTKQSATVVERLNHIKPGQNAFNADMPEHLKLNVKGAKISQIYKRLDPDKPAYTITGSGGGGTHVYHWSEPRALTNRERARLQTFPDEFEFKGSKEEVRKQIGMAVPCKGAQIIFEAILKTFASIPYESVDCNIDMTKLTEKPAKKKRREKTV